MAKRFTDSEKWKKGWFHSLPLKYKLFWVYLLDNCDNAGIWDVNISLAEFQVGSKLAQEEIEDIFKDQIIQISNSKWFIIDFILFQYNCDIDNLNDNNPALKGVIKKISKYNLKELQRSFKGASKGVYEVPEGTKDKDKDKDKDKEEDKDKDKDKEEDKVYEIINDFNTIYTSNYKTNNKTTQLLINARLNDGFTIDDFKVVHRKMLKNWGADAKMYKYLRPQTLYSNKFESYLNYKEFTTKLSENGIKAYLVGQAWLSNQKENEDVG